MGSVGQPLTVGAYNPHLFTLEVQINEVQEFAYIPQKFLTDSFASGVNAELDTTAAEKKGCRKHADRDGFSKPWGVGTICQSVVR